MDVFISWSGERSKIVAAALKKYLKRILHGLEPWYSEDTEGGSRWSTVIAERLDKTNFGIVVIAPENIDARWLNFEAGALAKSVAYARVVPLLLGFRVKTELPLPLS